MSMGDLRDLRARFSEFDAVWAFVKQNKLPTCACSVRAWVCKDQDDIPWGHSDMEEKVARSICQARTVYEQQVKDPGGVDKLSVAHQGDTVLIYADGKRLISFKPMTPREVKYVLATQELGDTYKYFYQALEFVHRHTLPTCKCAVFSNPGDRELIHRWGYSASAEQVAAALSATWGVYETHIEAIEAEHLESVLRVERKRRAVSVFIEDWELLHLAPLTPVQVAKAKAQWIEHTIAAEKKSESAKKGSPSALRARLKKRGPFKSGQALFDYMPGGRLHGDIH